MRRALTAGIFCIALLLLPATADAGWTPARDLPSDETFAPAATTAGDGTEVVGYLGLRGGATVASFADGRLAAPRIVEREGYWEASGLSLATSRTGRRAAAWLWLDGTDDGVETRIECCTRAVVATWRPGGKPRRRVLSRPNLDVRDVTVEIRPDGRTVVAWQEVGSGAIRVALERRDGTFRVHRVDQPAPFKSHFQDVFLAIDRDGREIVNWIEGGLSSGPTRFMTARSDRSGRFGPPRQAGEAADVGINYFEVLTDARGGQVIAWTTQSSTEDDTLFIAQRAAGGDFGSPRSLGLVSSDPDAAVGPRGDAIVVWTRGSRGSRAYELRRRAGRQFARRAEGLPGAVRYPRAGIDGAGRTTVLSSVGGRIEALHATDGRHFGRRVVISARRGGRARCGDARLDVAPSGDAIAIWGCAGPRFSERVQAAVYRP